MISNDITLMTDLYQLTMMQGYFNSNTKNKICVFDLFYRTNPSGNGYAITAGLEQAMNYIKNLNFTQEDVTYLRSLNLFTDEFLDYLLTFRFTGDIHAIVEGSVVFPYEPIMVIKAPIIEAQLIESALLNIINHGCLIATKASRVVRAADGDTVFEFGLRRAQGSDAAILGARASIIGGCDATSNVLAGKFFDIPVKGTHAHSWVMSFETELEAFREYVKAFPTNCVLLVDTYNTLKSGVPNAIKVFSELKQNNKLPKSYGIRLDSGDLAYLSIESRKLLDNAGFKDAFICASSDLDEYLIYDLKKQGAKITVWGVGTNLITSKDCPAFGGVYKLVAESDDTGKLVPKIKISENPAKITNPGVKKIFRLYDSLTNKMKADLICLDTETIDTTKDLVIFDEKATWKRMILKANEFYTKQLLVPIFINGKCVYKTPSVMDIKDYCQKDQDTLWDQSKRFLNPHIIPVDLSLDLYNLKQQMLNNFKN